MTTIGKLTYFFTMKLKDLDTEKTGESSKYKIKKNWREDETCSKCPWGK